MQFYQHGKFTQSLVPPPQIQLGKGELCERSEKSLERESNARIVFKNLSLRVDKRGERQGR
ncbi:hypothetical protein EMIT0232MI5_30091 [Pseudomonas sp. IT-232MI5]